MSTYQNKDTETKDRSISAENLNVDKDDSLFDYREKPSVAVVQRKFNEIANNSPKTNQLLQLQNTANNQFDNQPPIQRKRINGSPKVDIDNTDPIQEDLDELNQQSFDIQDDEGFQKEVESSKIFEDDGSESDRQIDVEGKLTTTAKVKGFFGLTSTWDKFTRGVEKYNVTKNVAEKQKILLDLKINAREWLRRHDITKKEGDVDENDILKQKTIYKFLNHTKSNFPQIRKSYHFSGEKIKILNKKITSQGVKEFFNAYKEFKKECDIFFSNYTADINLLFVNERDEINEFIEDLKSSALIISTPNNFDTGMGIEILTPKLEIRLEGTATISGGVSWSFNNLTGIEGYASAEFNKSGYVENSIAITNGSAHTNVYGVDLIISGLEYQKDILSAKKLEGQTKLFNSNVKLKGTGVSIVGGNLKYDSILASCDGDLQISNGIIISNPKGEYLPDGTLVMNGGFSLNLPNVANASGSVECTIKDRTIKSISISEGSASGDIHGIHFNLDQISYNNEILSIASASGSLNIFNSSFSMKAEGLNFDQEKNIDFTSISGKMPGVDVGFFSTKETTLNFEKEKNLYSGATEYTFENGKIKNLEDFKTVGKILIEWAPGNTPHLRIDDGSIDFKAFKQSVSASKINYDTEKPLSFQAGKIKLESDIQGYKPVFTSTDVVIDEKGMHFGELSSKSNIKSPSLGPFTLKPKELTLKQVEEKGYNLVVDGELNANFPNQFGAVSGVLDGKVIFSTFPPKMDYILQKGEANMKVPNPLKEVEDLFGGGWSGSRFEISAGLPVFPGIMAVFGIFIAFKANINDILGKLTIDNEKNSLIIKLNSGITGEIDAGLFGGIQGGSQLLASLAILLEMASHSSTVLDLGYEKQFGINQSLQPSDIDPKQNKEGFTYELEAETKGSVSLKAIATALYFFQKTFTMTSLGEKSLGKFEFSNKEGKGDKIPETDKQKELFTDEQLQAESKRNDNISEEDKQEISKLSAKELLDIDFNRRFKSSEKEQSISAFKKGEKNRKRLHKENIKGKDDLFNEVPFTNLVFFNEFINNRINWDKLENHWRQRSLTIEKCDQMMETDRGKEMLKEKIKQMGEEINITSPFINFYEKKINAIKFALKEYKSVDDEGYIDFLEGKKELFDATNKFKRDHLHSSFWGAESKQAKNITDKGYQKFKQGLSHFYSNMIKYKDKIPTKKRRGLIREKGSDYLLRLRQEHRNRLREKDTK